MTTAIGQVKREGEKREVEAALAEHRTSNRAIVVSEVKQARSNSPRWLSLVVGIDLVVAGGVFLVVAVVAPDDGLTGTSLRQGIVLAAVFAEAPIAALARGADSASFVALGGGMMVAGAATTSGGNLVGPVMAFSGLLLLLVGGSGQPKMAAGLIGWLLVYGIMVSAGVWLASDTAAVTGLAALVLAVAVASSTHWRRFSHRNRAQERAVPRADDLQ